MLQYLIAVVAFIFALIAFLFMPAIVDSFHETLVETQTDQGNITTGGGETTGNITLATPLYMDRLSSVSSITSTLGTDAPSSTAYTAATQLLVYGGLTASDNRIITVVYEYDATTEFPNTGDAIRMGPVIILISLIVIVMAVPLGGIFMLWRKAKGRG